MTDTAPRARGGAAAWTPRVTPPVGVDLDVRQKLACAFRILARTGFSENIAGHITCADSETGGMWVNPWGLWWDEVRASDVCLVSTEGRVLEGKWDVTPAIHIHTELHRRRADARVVVHNHPYYATVLAAVGVLPDTLHQTACMLDGDLRFVREYTGEIDSGALGAELAERIGDASVVLLANHGVIVTAPTVEEATYRAVSFERACRLMYDTLALERPYTTVDAEIRPAMKASLLERGTDVFWAGAVRMLLREQPEVLE
ncbi:MAG TPA: class II aldolase/adducin family protein [Acidimicrobiia bacterium]|nr:class II aldolase/adducin family protein [Acidimicrobiia bacterium]